MAGVVIGRILLGLACLLVLLLLCPVIVQAGVAGGEITVRVRFLGFIRLTLFPAKPAAAGRPKKARQKRKKAPKQQEAAEKAAPKKRTFSQLISLVESFARAASRAARIVLRALLIYNIDLLVPVSGPDAATVALRTGQVQALVGGTRAVLENIFHLRYKRLAVLPDFTGLGEEDFTFSCHVMLIPVILLAAGFVALFVFLRDRLAKRNARIAYIKEFRRQQAKP